MRLFPVLAFLLSALSSAAPEQQAPVTVAADVTSLLEAGEVRVPVLVALRESARPPTPAGRGTPEPALRRRAVAQLEEDALRGLAPPGFVLRHRFASSASLAGWVTREGLTELLRRPEVAAVTLDGVVRPAGQVSGELLGADRLWSTGVDGFGRTVAVVDSGIDAMHPDLGGGPMPNGKVLAGWNAADDSDDVMDCSGHGTAVAGVIASPQGVAPGAALVALRVFSARTGCQTGSFSDVLAAVDWAVTHRDEYRIDAINLSLAGDQIHVGFCDSAEPAAAAVFASARSAGIAVLAAAGNDGRADGVAWPACLSDVAAVGMVYATSSGPTSWGGTASCQDLLTGPDRVPCASNSGPTLSLLAPGVRWLTDTPGGGRTSTFSGTSASAPAAAAAVLLARQTRAFADPALAYNVLRATGAPIVDDKSGRTAPRIDLGTALDATAPITGECDSPAIPDGTWAGTTCEAFVSSLVGRVSSATVALTIDHPDPSQLVATLTAPDGTSVLLTNHERRIGALNEVFGRTAQPSQPLSRLAGLPAAGLWRLDVQDTVSGIAGRIVSWSLHIEPEAPRRAGGPAAAAAVIPAAVHHAGLQGAFFTSDVRLFNTDRSAPHEARLRFVSMASRGPDRLVTVTLPPGGTRLLDDVLGDAFRASDFGPIFVDAPPAVLAASRTTVGAAHGATHGVFVPAARPDAAIGAGERSAILLSPFPARSRLNVGVTEVAGAEASFEVTVKDEHGATRGTAGSRAEPGSLAQLNNVYGLLGVDPEEGDRLEVRVVSGRGRVVPFATTLDNRTNGGAFFTEAAPLSDALIPVLLDGNGDRAPNLDLEFANPGPAPVRVKVSYFPAAGPGLAPIIVPIGRGEGRGLSDVINHLFAESVGTAGAVRITVLDGDTVLASSRTYRPESGQPGLTIEPLDRAHSAAPGGRLALLFLAAGEGVRTDLGFVETAGVATRARLTLYAEDGARLLTTSLALGAKESVYWSDVLARLEIRPRSEASAVLDMIEGGSVAAYAIVTDRRTGEARFLPAAPVP